MERRAKAEQVVEEVLRPLLQRDGGDVVLVDVEGDEVELRLSGAFLGDPGTSYVKSAIIEPALQAALGPDTTVRYAPPRFVHPSARS